MYELSYLIRSAMRASSGVCILALFSLTMITGCSGGEDQQSVEAVRPVTVTVAKSIVPVPTQRVTGSLESWKQEDLGFEVTGRLAWVIDAGKDVAGPNYSDEGKEVSKGDAIASIDDTRYVIAVERAESQVNAAKSQEEALRVEIENILPKQLEEAKADRDLQKREKDRMEPLKNSGDITASEFDKYETQYEVADSRYRQVLASQEAKKSELAAAVAQRKQNEESLRQARIDQDNCVLTAPFSGRVASVHVVNGAIVQAGQPVITLIMMDPLVVEIAVSQELDSRIAYRDSLIIVPKDGGDSFPAPVYNKDASADPATRTYKITLLARNSKVIDREPTSPGWESLPRIGELWKPVNLDADNPDRLYIERSALYSDSQGKFVWKLASASFKDMRQDYEPVFEVKKVRVQLGSGRIPILSQYLFFELQPNQDLPFEALIASGLEDSGLSDGGKAAYIRRHWRLRPGGLVDVELAPPVTSPGIYLPLKSVLSRDGQHFVFVAKDGACKSQRVTMGTSNGEFYRIESGLSDGDQVILDGSHYLRDGQKIKVTRSVEVSP